jgi:anti-anti-sigma factor
VSEQSDQLTWVDGVPVVRPDTEIDANNAEALRAALLAASSTGRDDVIVDLSETAFCDSTGLNVLVRAHKRLEQAGGELRLVTREPTLLRIFTVTGVSTMFHMFTSMADALAGRGTARGPARPAAVVPAPPG